jgi:DNA modification methylase
MNIKNIELNKLRENPNNPRTISDSALKKLVKSVGDFPQMLELRPIVVDDKNVVLGGNMRLRACKKLGLVTVPVVKATDLTDDEKRQFIVKDNVGFGEWDLDILKTDWDVDLLSDWGLDITDTKNHKGLTDENLVPENVKSVVKKGEIWQLGEHRLMCGDATSWSDVDKLTGGKLVDMVWTDPPYNVNVVGKAGAIQNDNLDSNDFIKLLSLSYKNYFKALKKGGVIYVAHGESERVNFTKLFIDAGFKLSQTLIWNKHSATLCRTDYNFKHEPILYGWKTGAGHYFCGDYSKTSVIDENIDIEKLTKKQLVDLVHKINQQPTDVVDHKRPTVSDLHPTMKPVELVQGFIENSSTTGDVVLDLFGGAGSTLVACANSDRVARIMELDEKYCDVIIQRWQEYTGLVATKV